MLIPQNKQVIKKGFVNNEQQMSANLLIVSGPRNIASHPQRLSQQTLGWFLTL